MYRLTVTREFDSAHRLKNYEGKCAKLHGHRWKVELTYTYDTILAKAVGFCEDFGKLKGEADKIIKKLDHEYLNDLFDFNPTAEQLARYIYVTAKELNSNLSSVCVYETPDNKVVYYEKEEKTDGSADTVKGEAENILEFVEGED